ncbi:hypothetical protein ACFLVM_00515 [Chloroflexota bacterium]
MVIKLRNYHKHSFIPLPLLLSAVCVLVIVTLLPFGVFAQEQEPAEISSPLSGNTLEGSTATFAWSAGSQAEEYFLYLGTTPGTSDLYGQPQGLNLEATVSGLPVDGSTIYITMWTLFPTGWSFMQTSVLAADQGKSTGNLVLVKEKLKIMNELIQKAIDDYRNDVIEEDELRTRIYEIVKRKYEAMEMFPDVWGIRFIDWYHWFAQVDLVLFDATTESIYPFVSEADILEKLERAKSLKKRLEKKVDGVLIE